MIVSFYTKGEPYEGVANKYLIPSLKRFNLEYDIQAVESFGNWWKNTEYKPKFILDMMEKYPNEDIIWLDVDSEILAYPELLFNIPKEYNLAVYYLDLKIHYGHRDGFELVSAVGVFREHSRCFVNEWLLNAGKFNLEQKALQNALKGKQQKVFRLPNQYCCIKRADNTLPKYIVDPIIVQHQSSRQYKTSMGGR